VAAAAAAALNATLANGEEDNAVVLPNCGKPAAVDIYADANGFASGPAKNRDREEGEKNITKLKLK